MLWFKALHMIAMVAWFAGIFYLPRLFVYHADTQDKISLDRFKIMEKRLYFSIMYPAAILTTGFGLWLIMLNPAYYLKAGWMHAKLSLVILLWIFHFSAGYYRKKFAADNHQVPSAKFFRFYNELPTILLIGIIILVVVKPF